jgi:predicted secreted Zn-dependent protease
VPPADIDLTISMDTVYYDVSGVTTEEIFDSIRANGPDYDVGIESKFASGLTHAEPSYQLEFLDKAT